MELDLRAVAGFLALEDQLVDQLHAKRADEEAGGGEGGDDGCVDLVEFVQENLDIAHHGRGGAVASEVGLGPDIAVGAEALLLVLQIEGRHGRMVAALLGDVASAALSSVYYAGKGLTDDGVVRLLAALGVRKGREKYVGFVVPAG